MSAESERPSDSVAIVCGPESGRENSSVASRLQEDAFLCSHDASYVTEMTNDEPLRRPLGDGTVLLEYEALASTQDAARTWVRAGATDVAGVRTAFQSAGRGRRGATWLAPPHTCLLVTYILRDVHSDAAGHLAFAAGVAVTDAVETRSGLSPRLKWPNDVLIAGRKAAGILIEMVPGDPRNLNAADDRPNARESARRSPIPTTDDRQPGLAKHDPTNTRILNALVGIGLNVNVERFPESIEKTATSLRIEAGRMFDIEAVEADVRLALLAAYAADWPDLLAEWTLRDATSGTRYRADLEGREVVGTAVGIGDRGALLLRTDTGATVEVFSATSADA